MNKNVFASRKIKDGTGQIFCYKHDVLDVITIDKENKRIYVSNGEETIAARPSDIEKIPASYYKIGGTD